MKALNCKFLRLRVSEIIVDEKVVLNEEIQG